MKILYVIHAFLPHESRGAEIAALNEMKQDLKSGHEVCVFYRHFDEAKDEYVLTESQYDQIHTFEINLKHPQNRFYESSYLNPKIDKIFSDLLDCIQPNQVKFHHLLGLSMNLPHIVKEKKIASSYVLHDFWGICDQVQMLNRDLSVCRKVKWQKCLVCRAPQFMNGKMLLRLDHLQKTRQFAFKASTKWISILSERIVAYALSLLYPQVQSEIQRRLKTFQQALANVDTCSAPSMTLARILTQNGIRSPSLKIKPYVENEMRPYLEQSSEQREICRIGFVGSLIPSKGVHVLLDALKYIKKERIEITLYGSFHEQAEFPGYQERLKTMMKDSRVEFKGEFSKEHWQSVYQSLDCLVVPSIWMENAPLVLKEAASQNLFVITSKLGGMAEFTQSYLKGIMFKPTCSKSLARAIKSMYSTWCLEKAN